MIVANAVDLGEERDVLVDGQIAVQTEALRQIADALGDLRDARAPDRGRAPQFAGVGVQQPAHQPDRRGLAGAVGADQPEHLALAHVESEVRRAPCVVAVPLRDARRRTIALIGSFELRVDRHAQLQDARAVVHGDLDAVDELRSLFGGLHVARRELGARRHEGDLALEPWSAGVGEHGRGLPERHARHHRLRHEQIRPGVIEVGDDDERRAAARRSRPHPPASA